MTDFVATQPDQDSKEQRRGAPLFIDYDHDGDLDLFTTGDKVEMYRNNADDTFSDVSDQTFISVETARCTRCGTR